MRHLTNTELLNRKIEQSGYKRSYIAKNIGLSAYGLALKINNVNQFNAREIDALCVLLPIDSLEEKERIFFAK